MAKPLTELVSVKPVPADGGIYHFVIRFSGDKSDFTCFLDAEVTVTAAQLLDYFALQIVVLEQSGLFLQINGADEKKATWLDRIEKFLELPPKK
jgi:hypothetical protein